jgi:hypothetical protein
VAANAFQSPVGPRLEASHSGTNIVVSWVSPSPGFVLQEVNQLKSATNNWVDATNTLWLAGASNIVTMPLAPGMTNQFYRTRQR